MAPVKTMSNARKRTVARNARFRTTADHIINLLLMEAHNGQGAIKIATIRRTGDSWADKFFLDYPERHHDNTQEFYIQERGQTEDGDVNCPDCDRFYLVIKRYQSQEFWSKKEWPHGMRVWQIWTIAAPAWQNLILKEAAEAAASKVPADMAVLFMHIDCKSIKGAKLFGANFGPGAD